MIRQSPSRVQPGIADPSWRYCRNKLSCRQVCQASVLAFCAQFMNAFRTWYHDFRERKHPTTCFICKTDLTTGEVCRLNTLTTFKPFRPLAIVPGEPTMSMTPSKPPAPDFSLIFFSKSSSSGRFSSSAFELSHSMTSSAPCSSAMSSLLFCRMIQRFFENCAWSIMQIFWIFVTLNRVMKLWALHWHGALIQQIFGSIGWSDY